MAYASWSVVFGEQPSAAKWNILGTNDASFNDGTGIADGAIKPEHLLNGSSTLNTWAYDSWTPTLSNRLNNTKWDKVCAYMQIGKTVICRFKITANTTTPMDGGSAGATFTLPVTAVDYSVNAIAGYPLGEAGFIDNGTTSIIAKVVYISTTTANFMYNSSAVFANPTSTAPFTWTTSDAIYATFTYQAA